ncbi:DUF6000 family protein [Streptomyces avicenniae]|uniref:DUF6000 family protein n=1 Tax=Streptomyces avicenniae TaxID=500153 RepID=UPI00069A91D2|nr:DUF6000 family protein [Streptomyces avicenniae]
MPLPPSVDGPEPAALRRYVDGSPEFDSPRYLVLRHLDALPDQELAPFLQDLGRDARRITDAEVELLLRSPDPDARTVAAWMIGVDRRERFRDRLGTFLRTAKERDDAGWSHCSALALLGTRKDAALLLAYLKHYLRRPDRRFDQYLAIGALLHLDGVLGSDHAGPLLVPGGLWESWATVHEPVPARTKEHFDGVRAAIDRHARLAPGPRPSGNDPRPVRP